WRRMTMTLVQSSPTIGIVITAYNRACWIRAAIESALSQSVPPIEVLVVDDGSNDGTVEIVSSFGPAVRLICLQNDGTGQTRPLNVGIDACAATHILLLDSDDRLDADAVAYHLAAYSKYPYLGLVSSNWIDEYYSREGRLLKSVANEAELVHESVKADAG